MTRTPDEIKKGLECVADEDGGCSTCPYRYEEECKVEAAKDALALIQQLETDKQQLEGLLTHMNQLRDAAAGRALKMEERVHQLEAELADTKKAVGYTNGLCDICKHKDEHENDCEANDFLCYNCPAECDCKECYPNESHYEWHGVQKEE